MKSDRHETDNGAGADVRRIDKGSNYGGEIEGGGGIHIHYCFPQCWMTENMVMTMTTTMI